MPGLAFRWLPDERVLLVSREDRGQVQQWDAITGEPLGDIAEADCSAVLPLPGGAPRSISSGKSPRAGDNMIIAAFDSFVLSRP